MLFEYHKDGLLGERYIDDEEVEETLNQQGMSGWELVGVTPIKDGLLAFCKRPRNYASSPQQEVREQVEPEDLVVVETGRPQGAQELNHRPTEPPQKLEKEQPKVTGDYDEQDIIGEIKIR